MNCLQLQEKRNWNAPSEIFSWWNPTVTWKSNNHCWFSSFFPLKRNMVLAERCVLLSAEILKSQGKYSEAATILIKMTSEVRMSPAVLTLELTLWYIIGLIGRLRNLCRSCNFLATILQVFPLLHHSPFIDCEWTEIVARCCDCAFPPRYNATCFHCGCSPSAVL